MDEIEQENTETIEQYSSIYLENAKTPNAEHLKICRDIDAGSYKIKRFSKTTFRGKTKTYIHIVALEDGKEGRNEMVVSGYYIEEEIRKIEKEEKDLTNIKHPAICRLGMLKTNPNKRKFRTCQIKYTT